MEVVLYWFVFIDFIVKEVQRTVASEVASKKLYVYIYIYTSVLLCLAIVVKHFFQRNARSDLFDNF